MRISVLSLCVFSLLAAPSFGRIVPLSSAPYARRSQVVEREVEVELPGDVGRSPLHNRVTRHIRPFADEVPQLQRRDDVDNGAINRTDNPQPIRGPKGATFLHESNKAIDRQNADYLSVPPTDNGVIPNLKWSFSLSKTRLLKGGWVREQVVTDLPTSTLVAAAEQRLAPYAYRELHWHRVAEWAFVLKGTVRITGNDEDDRNYVADVQEGDLWSFPQGVPHSLQAGPEGAEYLLVFDDGNFDACE